MRNSCLAAALIIAACASGGSTTERQAGLAYQDMTLKVREICENMNRVTDNALREVELRTDNPELRRQTILWRMYTLTHCRQAVINPSPPAAFFDPWVMILHCAAQAPLNPAPHPVAFRGAAHAVERRLPGARTSVGAGG